VSTKCGQDHTTSFGHSPTCYCKQVLLGARIVLRLLKQTSKFEQNCHQCVQECPTLTRDLRTSASLFVVNKMSSPQARAGPNGKSIVLRGRTILLQAATLQATPNEKMTPWQKLATDRLGVANTLARTCVALFAVLVILGANSFSVMSQQSRLCSSLLEAHSSIDKYQASTLPTTPIINSYCN